MKSKRNTLTYSGAKADWSDLVAVDGEFVNLGKITAGQFFEAASALPRFGFDLEPEDMDRLMQAFDRAASRSPVAQSTAPRVGLDPGVDFGTTP